MFVIPSLKGLSTPPTASAEGLVVDPGIQSFFDTSGFTTLYLGEGSDDDFHAFTIPFSFNFATINFGLDQNGGVFLGSNGYITFSQGESNYELEPPQPIPILYLFHTDKIMFEGKAGNGPTVKGVSSYIVYYRGTNYSIDLDSPNLYECQVIFYSDGKIQLNYIINTTSSEFIGFAGAYMDNAGSVSPSLTLPFVASTPTSSSFALSGDVDGTNWTSQSGFWS